MFKSVKYLFVFVVAINIASCKSKNNKPTIKFSADSSSIIIKNIDEASLFEIKKVYQANPDSVDFISVLLTPGDTDSLQDEINILGKTILSGDSLIFSPQKSFLKSKKYLVESYIGVEFANGGKLFKGTIKHNLEPQQQTLKR
ncbi:hypothetical protein [Pedobacter jejuensis]|uniref:Uncharacterized protein n=1 Tax=Pedobacter jejuensis TaxID=1268550 RepID=A0A3N0BLK0_9SPHI|nr:hypothetical protein [Pedobacter jejuensis]RNL49626.1 hypothetical protein D7004_19630 [Pedobacter jejuensis]